MGIDPMVDKTSVKTILRYINGILLFKKKSNIWWGSWSKGCFSMQNSQMIPISRNIHLNFGVMILKFQWIFQKQERQI